MNRFEHDVKLDKVKKAVEIWLQVIRHCNDNENSKQRSLWVINNHK